MRNWARLRPCLFCLAARWPSRAGFSKLFANLFFKMAALSRKPLIRRFHFSFMLVSVASLVGSSLAKRIVFHRLLKQLPALPMFFFRLFRSFPQRSSVLHSFFTTRTQFSIAIISAFKHSAVSAYVGCLKPAGDRGKANGSRRFPRVNRWESFSQGAPARCVELRRCGLLGKVLPKRRDRAAGKHDHCKSGSARFRTFRFGVSASMTC
jgi:hypothetical protein